MAAAGKKSKRKQAQTNKDVNEEAILALPPLLSSTVPPHTLILGTMLSAQSVKKKQFYAHPQNAFWRICGQVFGFVRASTPYEDQVQFLTKAGFVVWDVLSSCERAGSLDSNIKKETPADIEGLLSRHPTITRVVLNGQPAAMFFKRYFKNLLTSSSWELGNASAEAIFGNTVSKSDVTSRRTLVVMPSTSPANASMSYDKKLTQWRQECFIGL